MTLLHAEGNLIDMAEEGLFDIIVHGCNCQSIMGSGIALEMRNRYPSCALADLKATEQWPMPVAKLGNFSYAGVVSEKNNPFTIINAYTQINYLPRGIDHFEYASFEIILKKLEYISNNSRFGFPYIGMGLAGGNSVKIISMLENFANNIKQSNSTVTLVEFKG